jgi:hypothetical protein
VRKMLQLSDVKIFLKVDNNLEDRYISLLILLSKEMCENYMRSPIPEECPESINQACLLVIGHFYEKRNDTEPIPQVVYSLLAPYRKDGF